MPMPEGLKPGRQSLAELAARLGRLAHGAGAIEGLTPAQWSALRFFSLANRFSRTPSAFAAFHGTTRGTASQIIKGLVTESLLVRRPTEADGRSVQLELSDKARHILVNDPFEDLIRSVGRLPPETRDHFLIAVDAILTQATFERGRRRFGNCPSCRHFSQHREPSEGRSAFACRLMAESMEREETTELCVKFRASGGTTRPN